MHLNRVTIIKTVEICMELFQCDHLCIIYYQSCLDLVKLLPPVLNVAIL